VKGAVRCGNVAEVRFGLGVVRLEGLWLQDRGVTVHGRSRMVNSDEFSAGGQEVMVMMGMTAKSSVYISNSNEGVYCSTRTSVKQLFVNHLTRPPRTKVISPPRRM